MSTAAIVPSCTTAVNAAPGSSQPKKAGTMRRWAVLETGRNSVSPWTIPSTMACRASMRQAPYFAIAPRRGSRPCRSNARKAEKSGWPGPWKSAEPVLSRPSSAQRPASRRVWSSVWVT